jgi:hypothetical protein
MPAENTFITHRPGLGSPAHHCALVTPHDVNELEIATRGLSFAAAGALKVKTVGGETVVIPSGSLAAGIVHPLRVVQVFATGTDATDIVAFW